MNDRYPFATRYAPTADFQQVENEQLRARLKAAEDEIVRLNRIIEDLREDKS